MQANPGSGLSVCVLASGSKGNAIYISDGTTAILLDAGMSGVEIERRMKSRDLSPHALSAIVVSHEHADHIRGVGILSRRYRIPVFATARTARAMTESTCRVHGLTCFECGLHFQLGTLNFHPFSISHDAEDPAGFTVWQDGIKIGIATDLGCAPVLVREHLKGCRLLVLEANHDPEMLINGPYPWPLKQRIKGRTGHLSNEDSRTLLNAVKHQFLEQIILAHLSEKNNTPERALSVVGEALTGCRARLSVATQHAAGDLIHLP